MKSHELAKLLLEKPDVELIKQTDDEGNGYTPLHGIDFNVLVREDDYEYEVYDASWSADDCDMDEYTHEELVRNCLNKFAILY